MSIPNLVSDRPPGESLLRILIIIVVLGFVVIGPLLGTTITYLFYEGNFVLDLQNGVETPALVNGLLVTQSMATFVGLIVFPVLYVTRLEHKPLQPLFPSQPQTGIMLIIVAGIGLTFTIAMSPVAEWNMRMTLPDFMKDVESWMKTSEEQNAKLTHLLTQFDSVGDLLMGIAVIAVLPAIGEELVFRGLIQHELWRSSNNIHWAIWCSAAIFSAIHLQFYGFFPRLLLGALFGYLYYWSGNLWIPIFSHFFNNAFGVVMLYLYHIKASSLNVEDGEAAPVLYIVLCLVMTAALLFYTWRHYRDMRMLTESIDGDPL